MYATHARTVCFASQESGIVYYSGQASANPATFVYNTLGERDAFIAEIETSYRLLGYTEVHAHTVEAEEVQYTTKLYCKGS